MNIIDFGILGIIILSSVVGMYNGFVVSLLSICSYFVSWAGAFAFYPLVSKFIVNHTQLLQKLIYYTNGSLKISSIEERALEVSSLSSNQIVDIIRRAELPMPFSKLVSSNALNSTFNKLEDVKNIGQYFDVTIANIIINIISFLLLFFAIRILFFIVLSVARNITNIPVLKQFDKLFGAGFGVVRGVLLVFLIFALIPILLTLAPIDFISEYLDKSLLTPFFYQFNIFTGLVRGII